MHYQVMNIMYGNHAFDQENGLLMWFQNCKGFKLIYFFPPLRMMFFCIQARICDSYYICNLPLIADILFCQIFTEEKLMDYSWHRIKNWIQRGKGWVHVPLLAALASFFLAVLQRKHRMLLIKCWRLQIKIPKHLERLQGQVYAPRLLNHNIPL